MAQVSVLLDKLNEREREIILLLAEGLANKEIAKRLFLAPNTVKWYIRQLNSKLDTNNRDEIVARANELGLLETEKPPPPKHNLPYATIPFVGREAELAKVKGLLTNPDLRLLTLTGPGGIGKTRLALAVGSRMMDFFPDGIFFLPLASVGNPLFVVTEIARLFGLRDDTNEILLEKLIITLREQRLLLILDNFEHLISAGTSVVRLLSKTKHLKMVVTSREALNVSGEQLLVVDTLTLPPIGEASELGKYEASQLLLLRAQAADASFTASDENREQIVALCHYLEGLPLAIELAATRLAQLPISKLVALLGTAESRLSLLTSGPRDYHARQQTLRNTIDWSYQLLDENEQTLLARLSIFAGGCTLETAEQICNSTGDLPNVMEHLLSLVSKSLIKRHDAADEPRFVMLESIREYAWEKLLERDEAFQLYQTLIRSYLALVEDFEPLLVPDLETRYAPLDGELDNLRAVLAWSLGDENRGQATELGVRLAGSLSFFWYVRGMLSEGRYWLNLAARYALEPDVHRARIVHGLGILAWQQGEYGVAVSAFEEGISLWRIVGYRAGLAEGLHLLGHAQFDQREYEIAAKLFRESYTLYVEMDEIIATLPLISDLGLVAYHQHDYASAQELFKQSLALCREHDHKGGVMDTTNRLGDLMRLAGNYEAAAQLYEESLALGYELRANLGIASAKHKLGRIAKHSGDIDRAKQLFLESLAIQDEAGNKQGILECLAGLAGIIDDLLSAAKLFGAIEALLDDVGVPLAPADQQDYERDRDRVCTQPDVNCLAEPDEEMTLQEAVAYARKYIQPQSP